MGVKYKYPRVHGFMPVVKQAKSKAQKAETIYTDLSARFPRRSKQKVTVEPSTFPGEVFGEHQMEFGVPNIQFVVWNEKKLPSRSKKLLFHSNFQLSLAIAPKQKAGPNLRLDTY